MEPDTLEIALAKLQDSLADLSTINNIAIVLMRNASQILPPLRTLLHDTRDTITHVLTLIERSAP